MANNAAKRTTPTPAVRDGAGFEGPSVGLSAVVYFGLALIFFLPAFLPGRHIFGTDYLAGGYFFYDFVADRFAAGDLPKWVPYIFGGMPLFANPGSAYQPIHWLMSVLLPTSRVLPAVLTVHFGLAGLGMYLLERELGCRKWIAFVAGIAFQFTGLIVSWVYAGHDGRIIVATLAPLFFFFLRAGIRSAAAIWFVGAAGTLGLALLSFQIQNSYYLLLGAAIWALYSIIHLRSFADRGRGVRVVGLGLGAVAAGFLLAAVNFLPFLDYIPESPRGAEGGRGYDYSTSFSMPVGEIVSTAVPEAYGVSVADPTTGEPLFPAYTGENGFKLHTEYLGAFGIVLLVLGAWFCRRSRDWWFFAGLSIFMLTIAFGGHTPLYRLYYEILPGTRQFRAPSLSFFMVALSVVAMAGLTLERIGRLIERPEKAAATDRRSDLSLLPILAGISVAIPFVGLLAGGEAAAGWGRFLLFSAVMAGMVWAWSVGRATPVLVAGVLALATTADLWVIGKRFLHTIDPPEVIFAEDDVTRFLNAQPQPSRIWTFPFVEQYRAGGAYGGDFPMLYELDQVGGEHPNPLRTWVDYLGAGTQTYIDWHNVATDPQVVTTREGQAIAFRSQPGFLDAANIRYIISMAPISYPGFREVHRGSALIYENMSALDRAYLVPAAIEVADDGAISAMSGGNWDPRTVAFVSEGDASALGTGPLTGEAQITDYEPDRVVVSATASRAALLVLADNYYPGWKAEIGGVEAPILRVNHTMRGVVIPAGTSEVSFSFEPEDLIIGFYIYIAVLAALLLYAGFWLITKRRSSEPTAEMGVG